MKKRAYLFNQYGIMNESEFIKLLISGCDCMGFPNGSKHSKNFNPSNKMYAIYLHPTPRTTLVYI